MLVPRFLPSHVWLSLPSCFRRALCNQRSRVRCSRSWCWTPTRTRCDVDGPESRRASHFWWSPGRWSDTAGSPTPATSTRCRLHVFNDMQENDKNLWFKIKTNLHKQLHIARQSIVQWSAPTIRLCETLDRDFYPRICGKWQFNREGSQAIVGLICAAVRACLYKTVQALVR